MRREELNPPAIVQEAAESANKLIEAAKSLYQTIKRDEGSVRENWLRLGTILNTLQDRLPQDEYMGLREAIGLSKQRASECQRAAKLPQRTIAKCESWSDILEQLKTVSVPQVQGLDLPDTAGMKSQFCQRCQRVGPIKDCPACAELKGKRKPASREAGDDTEQEKEAKQQEKPKNGQIVFDMKRTFSQPFGVVVRSVDALASAFKAKKNPVIETLHQKLKELHEEFKRAYQMLSKQKPPE